MSVTGVTVDFAFGVLTFVLVESVGGSVAELHAKSEVTDNAKSKRSAEIRFFIQSSVNKFYVI